MESQLLAVSPIDGRYKSKIPNFSLFFSEYSLIQYRVIVEMKYLLYLEYLGLFQLSSEEVSIVEEMITNFDIHDAKRIKEIEKTINHDVKAVEYYIKEQLSQKKLDKIGRFVHFGLTSQDINNTSLSLMVQNYLVEYYMPKLFEVIDLVYLLSKKYRKVPMLSRTHGQPASPTTMGKELVVFYERLHQQVIQLEYIPITTKFGGAVGNLNAHYVSYPDYNWCGEMDQFIKNLGLKRQKRTTQIENYDDLCSMFDAFRRINVILLDLCKDIWTYISMGYFKQKFVKKEVGSSTMPHKINPIDFENAEGNLLLANTLFQFFSSKLPISRLQRDLTDSTVTRNIGVACAHTMISMLSIIKGISKLDLNKEQIENDLHKHWIVVAEAIQTILKREGVSNSYELLKEFTRNYSTIGKKEMDLFIDGLDVSIDVKDEMKRITPMNYIGYC